MSRSVLRIFLPAISILLLGATGPVKAQSTRTVDFNEALEIALAQSVSIRRAENNLETQYATVRSEKADFLPTFNLNSGASRNYGLQFDQTTGKLVNTSSDAFNMGANSGVNLFNGFADVASLEQARQTLASQEYAFERTKQTVVFNVIQNFLSVILAQENLRIRDEDVKAQEKVLERIEEFVRVEARPISDLYTQQATTAASEAQRLTAESQLQVARTRLIQTMLLDPLGDYEFVAPDPESIPLNASDYDSDVLTRQAFSSRPDLVSQESAISAAEQGVRLAKSGHLPTLNFSTGISTRFSSQQVELIGRDASGNPILNQVPFGTQLDNNRSEFLSLSLQIPLFNRLNVSTSVERSRVQWANAKLDLENLQQSIALEVRQAFYDYRTAVLRLEVTEKQKRAANEALQIEQERYNIGASTLVELTQSQARFVDAASQRSQAIFQFHFQEKLLQYYQGTLDASQPLFK
jgi:outer membrane protein